MTLPLLGAGGSGFNPNDLSGIALGADVNSGMFREFNSQTTPSAVNDPVGSWVPLIGPTLNSTTNNNRMTRRTVDGKNRLQADGLDDLLKTDDPTFIGNFAGLNKPFTVALWLQWLSLAASGNPWGFTSTSTTVPFTMLQNNTTPAYSRNRRNDANQANSSLDGTPNLLPHSYIATFDGSSWVQYVDGATVGSPLAITSGTCTFTRFAIGILSRTVDQTPFNGYLGNVYVYNRVLTAQEITDVSAYLLAN